MTEARRDICIIQEIFNSYNDWGHKQALLLFDKSLVQRCPHIILEPKRLADETSRWIAVGNFIFKFGTLLGGVTLGVAIKYHQSVKVWMPLAVASLGVMLIYQVYWQSDPCVNYQVERRRSVLKSLTNGSAAPHTVVLVYTGNRRRNLIQTALGISFASLIGYRVWTYLWCESQITLISVLGSPSCDMIMFSARYCNAKSKFTNYQWFICSITEC